MKKSTKFKELCKTYGVDYKLVPEVLSFEDACAATGNDPINVPIVNHLPERHQKRLIADYKLSVIADALRENKDVNYNTRDYKYFAVFLVEADEQRLSGFGLSCGAYVVWYSCSVVGARLCFENRDTAIFFGKHFLALHIDHHLLT